MWKFIIPFLLICNLAWAQQWRGGNGEQTILGASQAALIGYNSYNKIVQPLDNLLWNQCNEYLTYTSSTTITVSKGACVDSNSQGTIRLFMMDTSSTLLTSSNLDTGSITASTTYYVYSTAATSSSTTSTYYISASNIAPSGQTYYYQIGSFTTDSSTQIMGIVNNIALAYVGSAVEKSFAVTYQALTDVFVAGVSSGSTSTSTCSEGSISGSLTEIGSNSAGVPSTQTCYMVVPKGNYYEVTGTGGAFVYVSPLGK